MLLWFFVSFTRRPVIISLCASCLQEITAIFSFPSTLVFFFKVTSTQSSIQHNTLKGLSVSYRLKSTQTELCCKMFILYRMLLHLEGAPIRYLPNANNRTVPLDQLIKLQLFVLCQVVGRTNRAQFSIRKLPLHVSLMWLLHSIGVFIYRRD